MTEKAETHAWVTKYEDKMEIHKGIYWLPKANFKRWIFILFLISVMTETVRKSACRAEQGMSRWVMGQMGHENRMGHMGHGSLGVDPWPISFLTLWLGIYIVAMIICRVSLWCMCNCAAFCACDWRNSKFTFTFEYASYKIIISMHLHVYTKFTGACVCSLLTYAIM